jgi:hypothetical protein
MDGGVPPTVWVSYPESDRHSFAMGLKQTAAAIAIGFMPQDAEYRGRG